MTVRIYHSTDPDAPQWAGIGSFITILDAVLVDGYGSQEPAGWTKAFSGTNQAVYRNSTTDPTSSGMHLRVSHTVAGSVDMIAYKTMTDLNTGTDATSALNGGVVTWSGAYRWCIIADHKTFYMVTYTTGTLSSNSGRISRIIAAGDYESFIPGNVWNYFIIHGTTSFTPAFPIPGNYMSVPRASTLLPDTPTWVNVSTMRGATPGWMTTVIAPSGDIYYQDALFGTTGAVYGRLRGGKFPFHWPFSAEMEKVIDMGVDPSDVNKNLIGFLTWVGSTPASTGCGVFAIQDREWA